MAKKEKAGNLIDAETERRRDEIGRRMLNTPPKHRKGPLRTDADPLRAGNYFLVIGNKLRIVHPTERNDDTGSITADLYRNLDDYDAGRLMGRGFSYWP